jgi:predicted secreted protein
MKFLLILLLITACASRQKPNHPVSPGLSMADTTKKITVLATDTFIIELPVSLGTGFRWFLGDSLNKNRVILENTRYASSPDSRPGAAGIQTFIFKALSPGTTTIRLVYKQPWDTSSTNKEQSYSLAIH